MFQFLWKGSHDMCDDNSVCMFVHVMCVYTSMCVCVCDCVYTCRCVCVCVYITSLLSALILTQERPVVPSSLHPSFIILLQWFISQLSLLALGSRSRPGFANTFVWGRPRSLFSWGILRINSRSVGPGLGFKPLNAVPQHCSIGRSHDFHGQTKDLLMTQTDHMSRKVGTLL